MPDKQQRFLLGRLIVEEYRDKADPFILPKGNAAGNPFLLYGLYMTLNLRGILRFHGGIQCAEICKAASAQRIGICFQRFLVHKQHIFTSIDLRVYAHGEEVPKQAHGSDPAVIARKRPVFRRPFVLHRVRVIFRIQQLRFLKAIRKPFLLHAVMKAVHTAEKALNTPVRHACVGEQLLQKFP